MENVNAKITIENFLFSESKAIYVNLDLKIYTSVYTFFSVSQLNTPESMIHVELEHCVQLLTSLKKNVPASVAASGRYALLKESRLILVSV